MILSLYLTNMAPMVMNKYNSLSPFNNYSSNPPLIIKNGKLIGYLTTNESINGGVSPYILKSNKDKL